MIAFKGALETGVWKSEEGVTIEYSLAVLDEIRRLAVGGLNQFGHGGLEIGGVLYGSREGERITVASFAEGVCEHALGPGFVLSASDREAYAGLLTAPAGLEAVGWFRSHTRGGLNLDGHDCELFDRCFDGARSLGLTVKPTMRGPATAAFFVRERSGEIRPMAAREFALEPVGLPVEDSAMEEPAAAGAAEVRVEPEAPAAPPAAVERADGRRRRALRPVWMVWAAAAALCVYAGLSYWPRAPRKLALEAWAIAPGQVRIEWDHRSGPVLESEMGVLRIGDGDGGETILLDPGQLRSSSITYTQRTGRISVRLQVEWRKLGRHVAEEAIEFVGPPASPAAAAPAAPAPREVEASVIALPPAVVEEETARPAAKAAPNIASPERREPARKAAPAPRMKAATVAVSPLATVPAAPAVGTPAMQPTVPQWLSGAPPHPRTLPQPNAPAYTGPRSGRLIWTGVLGRRGVVEIDGRGVNLGSLSGALPGVAVSLRISPAEFSRSGLTVYTADRASQGRAEKPSQANGWNRVEFQFDAGRAGELVVLEWPNRSNEFERLVLRNDARTCPVIVVDWSVQP